MQREKMLGCIHSISSAEAAPNFPVEQACAPCAQIGSLGESWDSHAFCEEQISGIIKERIIPNHEKISFSNNIDEYVVLRELGRGGLGTVLLAAHAHMLPIACSTLNLVAIKAIKIEEGANLTGLHTELEVLSLLGSSDHPFLPRLHAHFTSGTFAFLVMDYCSGGDLNILRQCQADRRLSEAAIRFYAAELVLALEHLHGLGIVYRDLKPENVLISDSGHVVLTDFDLSLRLTSAQDVADQDTCNRCATTSGDTQLSTNASDDGTRMLPAISVGVMRRPSCFLACFAAGNVVAPEAEDINSTATARTEKPCSNAVLPHGEISQHRKEHTATHVPSVTAMRQISCKARTMPKMRHCKDKKCVAVLDEQWRPWKAPTNAEVLTTRRRCRHFVGTEEYVAPEVIRGEGYSYAVDWWALGVLLYELLLGRTPFKGRDRKRTFYNIVEQEVVLPGPACDALYDLLKCLLVKDPRQRLACVENVKAHAFFEGIQWELLQHIARPPFVPLNVISSSLNSLEECSFPRLESFLRQPTSCSSSSSSSSSSSTSA